MVASAGWIIPEPLAIPPTVKPSVAATECLGRVSVVMIASAASIPPSSLRLATTCGKPLLILSSGSGTPMRPVDSTTTSSSERLSRAAVCAAMAMASDSPWAPVTALATPELITTACGWALRRCDFDTRSGAACTWFVVNMAAPVARGRDRMIARSFRPFRRIPEDTPLATKPPGAVTLTVPPPTSKALNWFFSWRFPQLHWLDLGVDLTCWLC